MILITIYLLSLNDLRIVMELLREIVESKTTLPKDPPDEDFPC